MLGLVDAKMCPSASLLVSVGTGGRKEEEWRPLGYQQWEGEPRETVGCHRAVQEPAGQNMEKE